MTAFFFKCIFYFFILPFTDVTVLWADDNAASSKCTYYIQPHRLFKYSIRIWHRDAPFTKLMYSDTSITVPILPAWLQRLSDSHIATALAILWQCYPALQQMWLLCLVPAQILWVWRCSKSSRRLTYCGRGGQVHAGNLWAAAALMQPNNALGIMAKTPKLPCVQPKEKLGYMHDVTLYFFIVFT